MHPTHHPKTGQQRRVRRYVSSSDSYVMFNLLTSTQLFDRVEALLPDHRKRLYPPIETLSMFLALVLSVDGSCQQAVDDAAIGPQKRGQIRFPSFLDLRGMADAPPNLR